VFIGVALALLFYFAVRGSLLSASGSAATQAVNPYGIAALAGLVGLFSKQATDKLREVFETAFRTAPGYGDDQRRDKATNPRPHLSGVTPPRVQRGTPDTELTVQGQGFIATSAAEVRRIGADPPVTVPRTVTVVSATELKIQLKAADLIDVGEIEIAVVNPEPGGGSSNPIRLEIHDQPAM